MPQYSTFSLILLTLNLLWFMSLLLLSILFWWTHSSTFR